MFKTESFGHLDLDSDFFGFWILEFEISSASHWQTSN
jgi:hypothetical protein